MVNQYKLVNPYIKGELETKTESSNSIDAAKFFYKNLSEHFSNNVPTFYFTIQKGGSKGKFYNFKVTETKKGDEVNYSISPYTIKDEATAIKQYVENFNLFKGRFNGGSIGGAKRGSKRGSKKSKKSKKSKSKRRDSDSSSSDSSSSSSDSYDFYREAKSYVPISTQPLYYMYYDPLVYRTSSVFLPTWNPGCYPYCEYGTYQIINTLSVDYS